MTTPYHPQCDGLVERYNRTLLNMLAKAVHERPFKWDDHVCHLCFAYNSSVNPMTRYSPFYLMFGRRVHLPTNLVYGSPDTQCTTLPQYVAGLRSSLEATYDQVQKTMSKSLIVRKKYTTRGCMGNHSSGVILCGYIALLCAEANPGNYTAHGLGHSESFVDSLMRYIGFSMSKRHASD